MTATGPSHAIGRRAGRGPTPLSFPQERLFLLERILPGLPAYNVPTLVRVPRTLDEGILRAAFAHVVERHEVVRTRISLVDGKPAQQVAAAPPFELAVADVRALHGPDREHATDAFLAQLTTRTFDLERDVLLRAGLVHAAEDEDLLLVVFHHAASDHASSAVLFGELDELYRALATGRRPELPDLPVQYADFAQWQREQLAGSLYDELVQYWSQKLADAPVLLELPTDRPRPEAPSYRGELQEFPLERATVDALRECARRASVSPFMVLLTAFQVVLHRHSGQTDLIVGVPFSGRHHEETQALLGYFSNTLPIRGDVSGDPTFADLLARTRATVSEAQVHQELPFERIVEIINPVRTRSHSPLFQVLFGIEHAPQAALMLAGRTLQTLSPPGWKWARFDLSVIVREDAEGAMCLVVEHATDLFDAGSVERLLGHFDSILGAGAAAPETPVSELPLLTESERRRLIVEWNDTACPYERRSIHELFSDQARAAPERVAVTAAGKSIAYRQLERRSNQLARELRRLGVARGTLVGVCVDRSVELVVALLGVMKSGAAYVPVDPTYPPHRQEFILADAGVPVLITQARLLGAIDPRGAEVICIDGDSARINDHDDGPVVEEQAAPDDTAYVIYTSGSTGEPKGVVVSHRSVANLISHMRREPGMSADDVVANVTTPAFDLSVPDWYLPLTCGARLTIIPREATRDGVELADWLSRTGATFVQATPTTWQLLVDAGWKGSPTLKIVCGGEALPRELAAALLERGSSLWHMYGPTEATVWSSIVRLGKENTSSEHGTRPVPLGGPISNTSFYVLDDNRRPQPIGVPGELYIGGDGVARGYLGRPQLTAERFVADPFVHEGRMYRTGDMVRWCPDGMLAFHGRIDQQVKLRGFRIELGEIEAVLQGHPGVNAAAAVVREDPRGDRRLVAYVLPSEDRPPEMEDVRRMLKRRLPAFMVPSALVQVNSLPVTANGKLDRAALPALDRISHVAGREYVPPATPVEEMLASIWREVLSMERIGADDDFFDLGGHSLLAVQMLARVQESLGVDLYLGSVFEHATLRDLAAEVSRALLCSADEGELRALLDELETSET